jgi:hypothetical protein
MMNKNGRLAMELMGYRKDSGGHCFCGYDEWLDGDEWLTWNPEESDAQADMVVREIAKRGYEWLIKAGPGEDNDVYYRVMLYEPTQGVCIYSSDERENQRNCHIVTAACIALDSIKKPHRCKRMPSWCEWRKGTVVWQYVVSGKARTSGEFCHKCGADLNA